MLLGQGRVNAHDFYCFVPTFCKVSGTLHKTDSTSHCLFLTSPRMASRHSNYCDIDVRQPCRRRPFDHCAQFIVCAENVFVYGGLEDINNDTVVASVEMLTFDGTHFGKTWQTQSTSMFAPSVAVASVPLPLPLPKTNSR